MVEKKSVYKSLVRKPKGKRSLGRPRNEMENNIKIHLRKAGLEDENSIHLAQDRYPWHKC
jgi:hypothetical protein